MFPDRVFCYFAPFLAHDNDTWIRVIRAGSRWTIVGLQQAEYRDFEASSDGGVHLVATKPVLLAQFCKSHSADGNRFSDPFMTIVPPVEQYSNSYAFSTIDSLFGREQEGDDFVQYVNVIAATEHIDGILLDDSPLDSYLLELEWVELFRGFSVRDQPDFSMCTARLDRGVHLLRHVDPLVRFHVYSIRVEVPGVVRASARTEHRGGTTYLPGEVPSDWRSF